EWFDKENPYAFQDLTAIMIETIRKGYWDASEEIRQELVNAYAESVAAHGSSASARTAANEALDQIVKEVLNAPGNTAGAALLPQYQAAMDRTVAGEDAVEGFKMEKQDEASGQKQVITFSVIGLLIALTLFLLMWQGFRRKPAM
ncbi:MAG: cobaltochelatase subunit CobN, partial [Nitrospiria bacterium]